LARWAVWGCCCGAASPDDHFLNAKAASNGGLSAFRLSIALQKTPMDISGLAVKIKVGFT
jgi:hypothetical protein